MTITFDSEFATEYGMPTAILFSSICYWVKHNEANEQNFKDGRYWTYNSRKAFKKLFPFMSESTIYNALQKLEKEGLIIKGCFNENPTDRTMWYTISDKAIPLYENVGLHCLKNNSPLSEFKQCYNTITNTNNSNTINTTINTTKKDISNDISKEKKVKRFEKPTVEEIQAYCIERNNNIDAQSFYDFYESKGWMIGKSKMKDWKASVRTWERNRTNNNVVNKKEEEVEEDKSNWWFTD